MTTLPATLRSDRPSASGIAVSCFTARLLCFLTLALIFMGALVKSHDAGLSVPDWPTTYGYNMFLFPLSEWRANVFYEHTHRLVASFVGMLTLFLCCWVAFHERRNPTRWVAAAALGAVLLQGVLGGLTVIYLLPAYLSIAHGVLAQTYLLMVVYLSRAFARRRALGSEPASDPASSHTARWALSLTAVVWIQLVIGAIVRHSESGLAIPDFPTMGGHWFPMFDDTMLARINSWRLDYTLSSTAFLPDVSLAQVAIHAVHRLWALAVITAYFGVLRIAWRKRTTAPRTTAIAVGSGALLAVQVALGILTVTTQRLPIVASLHVVVGAALLAASWLCTLDTLPVRARQTVKQGSA